MNRCPHCINEGCDALSDVSPELLALASAKVDRTVSRYQRKLAGVLPFTDFQALLPSAVREARAA